MDIENIITRQAKIISDLQQAANLTEMEFAESEWNKKGKLADYYNEYVHLTNELQIKTGSPASSLSSVLFTE